MTIKRQWVTPQLIVVVRGASGESVLSLCKTTGESVGYGSAAALYGYCSEFEGGASTTCIDCSANSNS